MSDYEPCGLGICAANEGHNGTCAEASGWDEWLKGTQHESTTQRAQAFLDKRRQINEDEKGKS